MLILSSVTDNVQAFENQTTTANINTTNVSMSNCVQSSETTTDFVSITCCDMLKTLTKYTVQSTGDSVESGCQDNECLKLQIVQLFMNHTKNQLGGIAGMVIDTPYIKVSHEALKVHSKTILVLALLGQASLPEKLRDEHISLEYNQALDVLLVKDSTCTTDKTIYSTIIIASIALLLFFIATNIIQSEQRMHSTQQKMENPAAFGSHANIGQGANMHFLRLNSDSKDFFGR
jgi:hypothetical protein